MAKSKAPEKKKSTMPSLYGSHKTMVDTDATAALEKPGRVVCKDDEGLYETDARCLDNGLADINRYRNREK